MAVAQCRLRRRRSKPLSARWVTCAAPPPTPTPLPTQTTAEVADGEATTPTGMSKWETCVFRRRTLILKARTRASTRQQSHRHPARRLIDQSRRKLKFRKMRYRWPTTRGKASLTHSHPRHKHTARHHAAERVADAGGRAIDVKRNAKGMWPHLVSLAGSA